MTDAGSPPNPRHIENSETDSTETRLTLPGFLGPWVAVLSLWPRVDEHNYRLVAKALGGGRAPGWTFFTSLAVHAGLVESHPEPDAYVFREDWRAHLELELENNGEAAEARTALVDAWMAEPDAHLVTEIARWARDLERWDILEQIWLLLNEHTSGLSEDALVAIRDLPLEARHARPILTWATGAAESVLVDSPRKKVESVLQRLLLDSALLHADWSAREDTDEAVSAGTFRMIGERRLPSTHVGQSLDAAWRTKQEIDAFIDARSRVGAGPGRRPQAIFRAFSSRLALFRMDPLSAVNEARWATILADWEPVAVLASGVEALALSISREDSPAHHSDPPVASIDDDLGGRGLRGQGQLFEILADAHEALRRLDREGLDRCLELATADIAALAGVWSVRTSLRGWRAALWGEPDDGATAVSAEILRFSMVGKEQDEPLGSILLARTQVLLLTKIGAYGAAIQAAEALPQQIKVLFQARTHLWAGQYKQAMRLAEAGPYKPGFQMDETYRLTTVRTAAALLDGATGDELQRDAVREVRRLLDSETFVHLALMPKAARDAIIEVCRPELESAPNFDLMLQRLSQLNDAGASGARAVRITQREAILLPMLATDASVPDIARQLMVSVNTVRKQVVTLREKFEADSRAELVRKARTHGVLD